ncbi:hypothetical protein Scep_013663 [Stephania cephalantha]|uniref:BHLH domain-containing protein n=1 Tax=Stephania cephalantha TaxID=152367 RepID=A0AAP0J1V3_9MAGN
MEAGSAAAGSSAELYRMILAGKWSAGRRLMYGGGGIDDHFPLEMMSTATATALDDDDDDDDDVVVPLIPQPRALAAAAAASKNHREAEKRRRERINSHLNKLRGLLPSTNNSKTDKASLLGKVIQHMKELKQQTAGIQDQLELFPSETDEVAVQSLLLPPPPPPPPQTSSSSSVMLKASLCCEDRSDLLPDLIHTLKSLRLKTVRAEIATLGGRIRNVLLLQDTNNNNNNNTSTCGEQESIEYDLRQALNNLLHTSNSSTDRSKRRRIIQSTSTPTNTTADHHYIHHHHNV